MLRVHLVAGAVAFAGAYSTGCVFCAYNGQGQAFKFDLSTLPNATFEATPENQNPFGETYSVTQPCGQVVSAACGWQNDPMTQSCAGVGNLANISIVMGDPSQGVNLTLHGGFDVPPMPNGRNAVYIFQCDTTAPADNPPMVQNVTESPGGFYNVVWRTPAACGVAIGNQCPPNPPVPPPAPTPIPCTPGSTTCLPVSARARAATRCLITPSHSGARRPGSRRGTCATRRCSTRATTRVRSCPAIG